jgi:hypothetical protein
MEEVVVHLFSLIFLSFRPSEADYLVLEQFRFYGVRWLVSRPTPKMEDQGIPLRLAPTPWPVYHGCPTSSYATAGIAIRVSGALKPHHHDKVETIGGEIYILGENISTIHHVHWATEGPLCSTDEYNSNIKIS